MTAAAARDAGAAPGRLPRLLLAFDPRRPPTFATHVAAFGPLPQRRDLVAELEASGLRGRGGAAFPTAAKLRAVASRRGWPLVVANGVEGEPASAKDRSLCRLAPHLVLDGAAAAALAIGAREAVVAVGARDATALEAVERAIAERPRDRRVRLRTARVPAGFVVGEETALLQALAGRSPKPTLKPPYPAERGLEGRPTLVQNVETLAHVALVARFGAAWFRSAGASDAPGTALVTLAGAVRNPGVHEIEPGVTVAALVDELGGAREPVSGYLVGGYFGGWTGTATAHTLRLTPETLGAGTIVAFPMRACAVAECARVLRYLARQSAGQCGPCRHGLAAIAGAAEELARGTGSGGRRLEQLQRWAAQVRGRGACRHPDGAVRFAESALAVFADDFAAHARRGTCGRPHLEALPA